ncbi:MAG TPA: FdrA family protein [Nocardioidaceae bacterium]|nr:FdrA family protein [Nocardioidaceae bacterium]
MNATVEVRRGGYLDSVALMQVSRDVAAVPGVRSALVAMATGLNVDLAEGMGFAVPAEAGPNDMLVALDAVDSAARAVALDELEAALRRVSRPPADTGSGAEAPPSTVAAAARRLAPDGPGVALVSTPGRYAFTEAVDALDAGLHVMVFSDNVPLEQEVALKEYAASVGGGLVMGPDCGTAVLGGVGLGFANVVRPGPVGVVAASGTGAQHLMCLLDGAGVGVSHCLGVGGRDLSGAVGGRSTLRALDLLAADPDTRVIVLVSKPPSAEVARRVEAHARDLATPVVLALLGTQEADLTRVAHRVVDAAGGSWVEPEGSPGALDHGRPGGMLRGLYAGGTLCDEAMLLAAPVLGEIRSNVPLRPQWALTDPTTSAGHTVLDLGDDRLTTGRPHPMIDQSLRVARIRQEVADPDCGVLLLDVVLGHGATADPAGELMPPVEEAVAAGVPVVVSMVGTRDDPQDRDRQRALLEEAGAAVHASNSAATRAALDLLARE